MDVETSDHVFAAAAGVHEHVRIFAANKNVVVQTA